MYIICMVQVNTSQEPQLQPLFPHIQCPGAVLGIFLGPLHLRWCVLSSEYRSIRESCDVDR